MFTKRLRKQTNLSWCILDVPKWHMFVRSGVIEQLRQTQSPSWQPQGRQNKIDIRSSIDFSARRAWNCATINFRVMIITFSSRHVAGTNLKIWLETALEECMTRISTMFQKLPGKSLANAASLYQDMAQHLSPRPTCLSFQCFKWSLSMRFLRSKQLCLDHCVRNVANDRMYSVDSWSPMTKQDAYVNICHVIKW